MRSKIVLVTLMVKLHAPKVLWDHSLQLAVMICSYSVTDILFALGEVPKTAPAGSTADISVICQFDWFDWLMFHDAPPSYPNESIVLGQYLGLTLDAGNNGQVLFQMDLTLLTEPHHLSQPLR